MEYHNVTDTYMPTTAAELEAFRLAAVLAGNYLDLAKQKALDLDAVKSNPDLSAHLEKIIQEAEDSTEALGLWANEKEAAL